MCSILITNKKIQDFNFVNYYLKFRGPDHTNQIVLNGITFIHNLLSISGEFTPQPFVDGNLVAMHNGEIYNYGDLPSDGYLLIPTYKKYGNSFTRNFDGEFAVALVDFETNKLIVSTDIFRSKPLWIALDGRDFGISTYRSPLQRLGFQNVKPVPPNTVMQIDLQTMSLNKLGSVYDFDLTQYKTDFNDWTQAFENSIHKRTSRVRELIFIGLSSGYDSGAIACELDRQGVNYSAFTVDSNEPRHIIEQRRRKYHTYIPRDRDIYDAAHQWLEHSVEHYMYTINSSSSNYNEYHTRLHDDSGSNGFSMVCAVAKQNNHKIFLSGMGADELFSDYGYGGRKLYNHSNFGGLFPKDLSTIFPWNSFYGSTMESYLAKEEYVSGSYGIEGRYPFLDRAVVQEFLWLDNNLKNSCYKSVLDNYLKLHNYPYVPNQKLGFSVF